MQIRLQVLSEDDKSQVHERSLNVLAGTGVRVDSAGGRDMLKAAGAQVDETSHIVRFHKNQVEEALGLAPKKVTLGACRPGWDLPLNTGDCKLLMDGEGPTVLDRKTGKHRSLEQVLIDTETFRVCKQAHRGIVAGDEKWLDDVLDQAGPGGQFLDHSTTASAVRSKEWYVNQLGVNASLEEWEAAGRPDVIEEACEKVDQILSAHRPLPLDEEIDRELDRIRKRAADSLL